MKRISEQEYIFVGNRIRVSLALSTLREVLPFEGSVSEEEIRAVMKPLAIIEQRLLSETLIDHEDPS